MLDGMKKKVLEKQMAMVREAKEQLWAEKKPVERTMRNIKRIETAEKGYSARGQRTTRRRPTIAKTEQTIKRGGIGYAGHKERAPSLNAQYGILMDVLKDKVADKDIRSDIANNIERMPRTRARLVTNAELFDNRGDMAAVLTFVGMLLKDTKHVFKRFRGMVNLAGAFERFKKEGLVKGMFISAQKRQIINRSPIMITRIVS